MGLITHQNDCLCTEVKATIEYIGGLSIVDMNLVDQF